ncbi:hypothetical protein AFLA_003753 [Aspergillus flavus NRRL3357]|nr:hypothetical protein AFLA_003753 [Aspergillus flavus NRRL3357]
MLKFRHPLIEHGMSDWQTKEQLTIKRERVVLWSSCTVCQFVISIENFRRAYPSCAFSTPFEAGSSSTRP